MKLTIRVMMLLVCLLPAMLLAQDEESAVRAKILALEKAWNQSYKAGDVKGLASILDDKIILIEDDGSIKTKAEFLSTVRASTANDEQVAPESLAVYVYGKTAIAMGVIGVKGKAGTHRERFIDTWIEKNGTWVCIATDATPIRAGG